MANKTVILKELLEKSNNSSKNVRARFDRFGYWSNHFIYIFVFIGCYFLAVFFLDGFHFANFTMAILNFVLAFLSVTNKSGQKTINSFIEIEEKFDEMMVRVLGLNDSIMDVVDSVDEVFDKVREGYENAKTTKDKVVVLEKALEEMKDFSDMRDDVGKKIERDNDRQIELMEYYLKGKVRMYEEISKGINYGKTNQD